MLIVRSQNSSGSYVVRWGGSLNPELRSILQAYSDLPKDSTLRSTQLVEVATALRKKGYAAANLGKAQVRGDSLFIPLFPGLKYKIYEILLDSLSPLISR